MNSVVYVALPTLAFSGALMFLLPYLSPRRYFFAITVRPDFPSSESGRSVLRRYHMELVAVVLISVAAVWPLAAVLPDLSTIFGMLLPFALGTVAYLIARRRVRRYSVSNPQLREA